MSEYILHGYTPKLYYVNYLQCERGFRTKERILNNPYFLYVHKGKGVFIIGGREYKCKAGDLFFCLPGVPNTIISDDFEFDQGMPEDSVPTQYKEHINVLDNPQFMWILMELIHKSSINQSSYNEYVQALFKSWLLLVANFEKSDYSSIQNIATYLGHP